MQHDKYFSCSSTVTLLRPLVASNSWREFLLQLFADEHTTFERIQTLSNANDQIIETHRIIANDSQRRKIFNQLCKEYRLAPYSHPPQNRVLTNHTSQLSVEKWGCINAKVTHYPEQPNQIIFNCTNKVKIQKSFTK